MNTLITIGRQFGSGGREVGKKLSAALDIPFYDEEIIDMVAKSNNLHPDVVKEADERATDSLLFSLITGGGLRGVSDAMQYEMPLNDKIFIGQSKAIKELAQKGSGIFVGRAADYILEDFEGLFNVFIYANLDDRINRVAEFDKLSPQKAKDRIIKKEKQRKTFYNYYTDRNWGVMTNYDLCINTSFIGIDGAVDLIKDIISKRTK